MNEFEDRVSALLKAEAGEDRIPPGAWERNHALLTPSKRSGSAVVLVAAAVAVLAIGITAFVYVVKQPDTAAPMPSPVQTVLNTTPGESVVAEQEVPNVVGLSQAEAVATLNESGFSIDLTIVATDVADEAQVGKVQEQHPAAGVVLTVGDSVQLTIGKAVLIRTVPNVLGKSPKEAKQLIEAAGLIYADAEDFGDEAYKGRVQMQDPAQGVVPPATTVTVTIGKGREQIAVPDCKAYAGRPYKDAETELTTLGFAVTSRPTNSFAPADSVVRVECDAAGPGAMVQKNSPVTIFFSDATQFQVPDLLGQTPEAANQALLDAGWTAATAANQIVVETTNAAEIGKVISQDPLGGNAYPKVGAVTISVGVAKQITVQQLVGMTVQQAQTAMVDLGWDGNFIITEVPTLDPAQAGTIQSTSPLAGTIIGFNGEITIEVGAG